MRQGNGKYGTHGLGAGEGVLGGNGDSEDVLVGVDERVGDGGDGGVVEGEGDGGDGLDSREELVDELLLVNVEDSGGEDVTGVVDGDDAHSVGERLDVEEGKESSLGSSDTVTLGNDLGVVDDLNSSTGNLGGDSKSLEERGLTGLNSGGTSGDEDINGSEGTSTGRGGDLVGDDDVADLLEVGSGEDESDVTPDDGEELLEVGALGEEDTESTANHGVLSHEDDGLSTESLTDLVHLVGTDIVDVDKEDGSCRETPENGRRSATARRRV